MYIDRNNSLLTMVRTYLPLIWPAYVFHLVEPVRLGSGMNAHLSCPKSVLLGGKSSPTARICGPITAKFGQPKVKWIPLF